MPEKILFSWSGGKDSALALHSLQSNKDLEIAALLTVVTEDFQRVSMHGFRRNLLAQQAELIGCPLEEIFIPKDSSNGLYEQRMKDVLLRYKDSGVRAVAFGDIFLEDVKKYRENNLAGIDMKGLFPLWKQDSYVLAKQFIKLGFKSILTCVDSQQLSPEFCGRIFDASFIEDLPKNVDPCGENGEFHTFVYEGPIFRKPIPIKIGEKVLRDNRFWFCDVVSD